MCCRLIQSTILSVWSSQNSFWLFLFVEPTWFSDVMEIPFNCRTPETCPHRKYLPNASHGDIACCALLGELVGSQCRDRQQVGRDACIACCDSFEPTTDDLNPIIASLLYAVAEGIVAEGGVDGCDIDRGKELLRRAERSLPIVAPEEDDVVDIARLSAIDCNCITPEDLKRLLPVPVRKCQTRVERWCVGITTSRRRIPTLEQCVQSVRCAGWKEPVLFIDGDMEIPESLSDLPSCRRIPAVGAFPNYALSLMELYMRDPHADAYMMLQDDALFPGTSGVRPYLEDVLWLGETPGLVSLYCSTEYQQQVAGWYRFDGPWVWGAVAFVFSNEVARAWLASPDVCDHRALANNEGLSKIDVMIGLFCQSKGVSIHYPSPSLVQHIGTISTIWQYARAVNARKAGQFIGDLLRPGE
jgi:hypothetical protein